MSSEDLNLPCHTEHKTDSQSSLEKLKEELKKSNLYGQNALSKILALEAENDKLKKQLSTEVGMLTRENESLHSEVKRLRMYGR